MSVSRGRVTRQMADGVSAGALWWLLRGNELPLCADTRTPEK
jgi:hypothetical protein